MKDGKKAFELIKKSAEEGNADAQMRLGAMYDFGKGVSNDSF